METILIFWLFFVIVTGAVAASKDRSVIGWVLMAAIFSLFALIAVGVLPSQKTAPVVAGGEVATPATHVRCPDCKELVRADALVCYHCHRNLTPSPVVATL